MSRPAVARLSVPVSAAALLLAVAPASAADYVQAPGSTLAFATQYDGEVFSGHFGQFTTTVSVDPQHPEAAKLDVVIPLASAGTANPDRDQTLLGPDFFSAAKFPQARYSATGFRALGDGNYAADGTLTLVSAAPEKMAGAEIDPRAYFFTFRFDDGR